MTERGPRITIEFNEETHAALKQWAEEERRSLSKQIVFLLEKAIKEKNGAVHS